jgi:hypothetical protein
MKHFHLWQAVVILCSMTHIVAVSSTRADEGMWLFNDLPTKYLQSRYGFEPDAAWAQHVMLSSVRFNSGGSASFVSSTGLVLTNHHVASDTLQKISTPEQNFMRDGFLARTADQEVRSPDLELNQLVSIEDVTDQVNAAVPPDLPASEAFRARRAVMAEIEKQSLDTTGLRSDVVTLYGGAKYHLYRYKKYTDVRLVWAPETAAAFFGGDADNFEYPRYCLDVAIFRVYENDKPAQIEHFLKWSPSGAGDEELVFVSGNPGRTQRIFTVAALKYLRDKSLPYAMNLLRRREILLQQYSYGGEEQKRRGRDELFGIQNSRKAVTGMLQGLQTPQLMESKAAGERQLVQQLSADQQHADFLDAWKTIEKTTSRRAELLGQSVSFANQSQHYDIAETLTMMAAEDQKPSEQRLREYRDSARESLEQQLFSPAPIYDDLEIAKLADALAQMVERRGGDDPLVTQVLAGKSPRDRAAVLIHGTSVGDVDVRRQLASGGIDAIRSSSDPMIQLAQLLEPEYRRLREILDELDELERQAYARITEATVVVQGTSNYPDATFTLRLAFGTVKGYVEDGKQVPPWTTIGGAFQHEQEHGAKDDWQLPLSWHKHKAELDLQTPLNFVCTADIIGGNSGSPVLNRNAELVGVIFDGNIQSLTADFLFSDQMARAVAVHTSGIREALAKIYGAAVLADELGK